MRKKKEEEGKIKSKKDVIQNNERNSQVISRVFPFFEFLIDFLFFSSSNWYIAQLNPIFNPLG